MCLMLKSPIRLLNRMPSRKDECRLVGKRNDCRTVDIGIPFILEDVQGRQTVQIALRVVILEDHLGQLLGSLARFGLQDCQESFG